LTDSFYFKLIILSPWIKTLQQFKVKIDRSVITNMIQKKSLLKMRWNFQIVIKNDFFIRILIVLLFNSWSSRGSMVFLDTRQSVLQGLMPFGHFRSIKEFTKTTPPLFNKNVLCKRVQNNGSGCSSLIILVTFDAVANSINVSLLFYSFEGVFDW